MLAFSFGAKDLLFFAGTMLNLFFNPPRAANKFGYWRGPLVLLLALSDSTAAAFLFLEIGDSGIRIVSLSLLVALLTLFFFMLWLGIENIYKDISSREYKKLARHHRFFRRYF